MRVDFGKNFPTVVTFVRHEGAVMAALILTVQQPSAVAALRPVPDSMLVFVSHFGRPEPCMLEFEYSRESGRPYRTSPCFFAKTSMS